MWELVDTSGEQKPRSIVWFEMENVNLGGREEPSSHLNMCRIHRVVIGGIWLHMGKLPTFHRIKEAQMNEVDYCGTGSIGVPRI